MLDDGYQLLSVNLKLIAKNVIFKEFKDFSSCA